MEKLFSKKPVVQPNTQNQLQKRPPVQNSQKPASAHQTHQHKSKPSNVQVSATQKIFDDLKSSKFRLLNEYLYTKNSEDSLKYFHENPEEFNVVPSLHASTTKASRSRSRSGSSSLSSSSKLFCSRTETSSRTSSFCSPGRSSISAAEKENWRAN